MTPMIWGLQNHQMPLWNPLTLLGRFEISKKILLGIKLKIPVIWGRIKKISELDISILIRVFLLIRIFQKNSSTHHKFESMADSNC